MNNIPTLNQIRKQHDCEFKDEDDREYYKLDLSIWRDKITWIDTLIESIFYNEVTDTFMFVYTPDNISAPYPHLSPFKQINSTTQIEIGEIHGKPKSKIAIVLLRLHII